jgi:transcriptional adapter 2-alpha
LDNFRKIQGIEKKRNKEEKELLQKVRVFSRMLTDGDFNLFVGGLLSGILLLLNAAYYLLTLMP